MTFVAAIRSGFLNYVVFSGRATRSEYWYWTLFSVLVGLVVDVAFGNDSVASLVLNLVLLLPSYAVLFRRLHDTDHSGWWNLLFLTIIGIIPLIIWLCRQGTSGPNRFGNDPLNDGSAARAAVFG